MNTKDFIQAKEFQKGFAFAFLMFIRGEYLQCIMNVILIECVEGSKGVERNNFSF